MATRMCFFIKFCRILSQLVKTVVWRPSSVVDFWMEFNETWQAGRLPRPLPRLWFGPVGKTRWLPWPLIDWDIFDFSSETAERNSTKRDRKEDLNVSYQVCVFGPIGKTRWPPWPLIIWDIFDAFSESAKRNSTKLTGSMISTSST